MTDVSWSPDPMSPSLPSLGILPHFHSVLLLPCMGGYPALLVALPQSRENAHKRVFKLSQVPCAHTQPQHGSSLGLVCMGRRPGPHMRSVHPAPSMQGISKPPSLGLSNSVRSDCHAPVSSWQACNPEQTLRQAGEGRAADCTRQTPLMFTASS